MQARSTPSKSNIKFLYSHNKLSKTIFEKKSCSAAIKFLLISKIIISDFLFKALNIAERSLLSRSSAQANFILAVGKNCIGLSNGVANKRFFTTLVKAVKGLPKINKLNYQTVSGNSQMFTIKLQKLEIYIGQDVNIFNNVTLACANESIGAGYDVILHTSHIGGKNCEITSTYTKVM